MTKDEIDGEIVRLTELILDARKAQAVLLDECERLRKDNQALRARLQCGDIDAKIREMRGGA